MLKNTAWLVLVIVLVMSGCAAPPPTPIPTATTAPTAVPGVLFVDPSQSRGPVSPYLMGSNHGPWIAIPVGMLDAAYASQVRAIRFPAGSWGDHNDVKTYQIDAFMDLVRQAGAMPTFSVRLLDGTPEKAGEMVRYTNKEKGYGVVYWSIGNEPTLFAGEVGVGNYDTVRFNREWREIALAMKAVDPSIKLIGPEVHQYSVLEGVRPKDVNGLDWMDEFLKANGDMVDVVTFHRYPYGTNPSIEDLQQQSQEWDDTIQYLRARIHELTGRDIPIAITEVNTNYNKAVGGEATPDSYYNAVWLADLFGQAAREGVFMVNHWLLASDGSYGGWGIIARGEVRASYQVFQLYSRFGNEMIYANSGVPGVNIYAARRSDGALTLMVVNMLREPVNLPLVVNGRTPVKAELWQLTPDQNPDTAIEVSLPADGMLSLPGQSVSLYILAP